MSISRQIPVSVSRAAFLTFSLLSAFSAAVVSDSGRASAYTASCGGHVQACSPSANIGVGPRRGEIPSLSVLFDSNRHPASVAWHVRNGFYRSSDSTSCPGRQWFQLRRGPNNFELHCH